MKSLFPYCLFLVSALLLFSACETDTPVPEDPLACSAPEFGRINYLTASRDPFTYQSALINDDCLELVVSYGGGCGEVDWKLVFTGETQTTNDVTFTDAVLSFKDDDTCEALLTDTLSYNLLPLQDTTLSEILIKLEGYNGEIRYQY